MEFFSLRWCGPVMSLVGPRIDGYAQPVPVPYRSMVAGLLGAALGLTRDRAAELQALQDHLRHAVVVHRPGTLVTDYQTANLGQPHLTGPMWWRDGAGGLGVVQRGGAFAGETDEQWRPLLMDADMTLVVELLPGAPHGAAALLAALERPAFPLYLGRASCPPSRPMAGQVIAAASLAEAAARVGEGALYLPLESAEPELGDLRVALPGGRDWTSRQHGGQHLYLVRG